MIRKILIILGILILTLGISGYAAIKYAESTAREKVIALAEEYTGSEVLIEGLKLSVMSGELNINNFVLKNHEGFESNHLVKFDNFYLKFDAFSFLTNKIKIHEASFVNIDFIYEDNSNNSNVSVIKDNFLYVVSQKSKDKKDKKSKYFIVEEFKTDESNIHIAKSIIPLGGAHDIKVPPIYLNNIGTDKNGVMFKEVVNTIVENVKKGLDGQVAKVLFGSLFNVAKEVIETPIKAAEEVIKLPVKIIQAPLKMIEKVK